MKVRAKEKIYYHRRDMMPGEIFDMDDREDINIKILICLGKIEEVKDGEIKSEPPPSTLQPTYETKVEEVEGEEAEPVDTEGDALTEPKRKTYYRRRDMRADK